ncbi:MAG: methyltransferase domain-containing protein [Pseudomonadota bacterium]
MATPSSYDAGFYRDIMDGSYRSARAILEFLFGWHRPLSVVDFGCGVGTWLKAARELGVADTLGLDGDYVDRKLLQIPAECFRPTDLSKPVPALGRTYDLAVSLEVAEHLPDSRADGFVADVAAAADVVLFSAAIPGQGGNHHVNERFPSYWIPRFASHGVRCYDAVRPHFWGRPEIEVWYRQNVLVFTRALELPGARPEPASYDLVHPEYWASPRVIRRRARQARKSEWRARLGLAPRS